jgi:hypothetical protein
MVTQNKTEIETVQISLNVENPVDYWSATPLTNKFNASALSERV